MDLLRSPLQWLHSPLAISSVVQEEPVHDNDVHVVDMEEGLGMAAEPVALYIAEATTSSADIYPPSVPSCTIKAIPGRGLGLVASRSIQAGETIISESPLIRLKHPELGYYRLEWEVKRLTPAQQADFWRLHHTGMEELPELFEIWTKNSFSSGNEYQAIFSIISRINNSCTPNTSVSWSDGITTKKANKIEVGSMNLIAGRDIEEGEEITVCYTSVLHSRNARYEVLQHTWEFACRCNACSLKGEALLTSERRRRRAASILESLDYEDKDSKMTFELVKEGLKILLEEQLHTPLFSMSWFAYQYAALYKLEAEAQHWASLAYEHSKLINGEVHPSTMASRHGMHAPTYYPASKSSWGASLSACVVA